MPWQWWYSCIPIPTLSGTAALSTELLVAASPLLTQCPVADVAPSALPVLTGLLTDAGQILVLAKTPLSRRPTCLLRSARYPTSQGPFPGRRR